MIHCCFTGPLATVLFSGTFEQSYIPHAVAYIACLGDQAARCEEPDNYTQPQVTSTHTYDQTIIPNTSIVISEMCWRRRHRFDPPRIVFLKLDYDLTCIT
jgi:hypothetical protein